MRGSRFLGRYATSTESSSGDPPSSVAFHCTKRAAPEPTRPPLAPAGTAIHALQLFCGRSRLPLRAASATCPPFRLASKLSRPHSEYVPESKTSLSMDPSRSSPGPISYTVPVFPVAAYRRPPLPAWNAVIWVAGSVTSEVYRAGDSMRYTLPLLPAPSRARPAPSKAMAYTTSCACPHTRRGAPSGSMRYTWLPPATLLGTGDGGGAAGCRAGAAAPAPTVTAPWVSAGAAGAGGSVGAGVGAAWRFPTAAT